MITLFCVIVIILKLRENLKLILKICLKTKPTKTTTISYHTTTSTTTTTVSQTTGILNASTLPAPSPSPSVVETLVPVRNPIAIQNGAYTVSASRTTECGVPTVQTRPETRIVGGKNAPFGRWPWQVSVRRTSFFGFSSTHRCGGAVINEQVYLNFEIEL